MWPAIGALRVWRRNLESWRPYAVFLTPGIIAFTAMNSATFETTIGSFTRMTEQNTYTAILATPCTVADVVAGDLLWAATKSAVAVTVVLALTAAFGLVQSPLAVAVVPLGFVIGLLFGTLGMIVTAKAPSYDFFNYYFTFVFSVMFLFSGVFFPLATLPAWARALAWWLPLTHAVPLCRALTSGTASPWLLGDALWIVTVLAGAFVLAERLVRRRLLV